MKIRKNLTVGKEYPFYHKGNSTIESRGIVRILDYFKLNDLNTNDLSFIYPFLLGTDSVFDKLINKDTRIYIGLLSYQGKSICYILPEKNGFYYTISMSNDLSNSSNSLQGRISDSPLTYINKNRFLSGKYIK